MRHENKIIKIWLDGVECAPLFYAAYTLFIRVMNAVKEISRYRQSLPILFSKC